MSVDRVALLTSMSAAENFLIGEEWNYQVSSKQLSDPSALGCAVCTECRNMFASVPCIIIS